jgi:hypothetical protein
MIAAPRYRECVETKLDSATRRFEKLVLKLEFGILPNACAMTRMGVRVCRTLQSENDPEASPRG